MVLVSSTDSPSQFAASRELAVRNLCELWLERWRDRGDSLLEQRT
jgi:hypothetical protein